MSVRQLSFVLTAVSILASGSFAAEPQFRVVTNPEQRPIAVEATGGWTKDEIARLAGLRPDDVAYLSQRFALYVVDAKGSLQLPPLSGSYEIVGEAVRFTPQFALRPGMTYQAHFKPPVKTSTESPALFKLDINIPAPPPAPPTRVTTIYPSADTLPDNQLRFYLHFSAPMAAGDAYAHVKLLKANGEAVHRPFLEIGEELWDGTFQRLTLLFDPGRVKRGLTPRELFGPVLETGQTYRLVIDKAWRDANGQSLADGFEKRFTAGPPIEIAVDSKQWKITPPAAGTRDPLAIRFQRPLDRALLMRMITVADSSNRPTTGDIVVTDLERRWEFRPDQPWFKGTHALVVDTALEDSAGNNLSKPFEVDVFDRVDDRPGPELVRIPFSIAAP